MSEWIKCSDRLPEVSGVYPACSMHPQRTYEAENWIEMLYGFDKDAKKGETAWQHGSGFYDGAITHWMPLPEPPETLTVRRTYKQSQVSCCIVASRSK